jgi:hypothetical protein
MNLARNWRFFEIEKRNRDWRNLHEIEKELGLPAMGIGEKWKFWVGGELQESALCGVRPQLLVILQQSWVGYPQK